MLGTGETGAAGLLGQSDQPLSPIDGFLQSLRGVNCLISGKPLRGSYKGALVLRSS
jgi:hypothetical protein